MTNESYVRAYDRSVELQMLKDRRGSLTKHERNEFAEALEIMMHVNIERLHEARERQEKQKKRRVTIDLTDFSNWEVH